MSLLPCFAQYTEIGPEMLPTKIHVICNTLVVKLETSPKKVPKYKKVGKKAKEQLLELVDAGCSIVTVLARLFRRPPSWA